MCPPLRFCRCTSRKHSHSLRTVLFFYRRSETLCVHPNAAGGRHFFLSCRSLLSQVEKIARRGGFGPVRSVDLQVARKSISLVMAATAEATRPPSAHEAEPLGTRDRRDREPGTEDAPHPPKGGTCLITSWLRVTARVQPG